MFPSRWCLMRKLVPLVLLNTLKTTAGTVAKFLHSVAKKRGVVCRLWQQANGHQPCDLKAIEKTFLTLPPQVYHCCLTAIKIQDEWTQEDETKFENDSMSKHQTATVTQRASDGK
jgi:hypothetical protein